MNDMAEFLKRRQSIIGGSDIAGILGLSPWKTPLDVYLSKIEDPRPWEMSEPAYWGHTLEEVVAQEYAKRTGSKVQRINSLLTHPEKPFLGANLDRVILDQGTRARVVNGQLRGAAGVLECKTGSAYAAGEWGNEHDDDAIPTQYATQGMGYLAVTGLPWVDFACLIGGQRFVIKRLHRDEEVIQVILDRCEEFWFKHVVARVPPEPVNAKDAATLFAQDTGETLEADEDLLTAYNDALGLREQIKAMESELAEKTEFIKLSLRDASALTIGGKPVITFKAPKPSLKVAYKDALESVRQWLADNKIPGAQDALSQIIKQYTTEAAGSRRFLIK